MLKVLGRLIAFANLSSSACKNLGYCKPYNDITTQSTLRLADTPLLRAPCYYGQKLYALLNRTSYNEMTEINSCNISAFLAEFFFCQIFYSTYIWEKFDSSLFYVVVLIYIKYGCIKWQSSKFVYTHQGIMQYNNVNVATRQFEKSTRKPFRTWITFLMTKCMAAVR